MDYTKEQLKERFGNLPKNIQQELSSDDLGLIIQIIGSDVDVTPEQALDVEDEVFDVLMGFSHPKDFIHNIRTKIGVDENKARAIAEKVNDEIFQLVKESLKIVHNITETASEASLASTASTASVSTDAPRSTLNVPPPPTPTPPLAPMPPVAPKPLAPTAPSSFPQMIVPPKINLEISPKPPVPPQSQNIFEQKLQGVFKMPREETILPTTNDRPQASQPPRQSGVDPYREPAR